MSDAPETVWATAFEVGRVVTKFHVGTNVEIKPFSQAKYRRADLPPTPAQIMADSRVKSLVDALERIAHASDIYGVEANAEDQGAETLAYAHKSTCNLARAALAQLKEPKP